MNNERECYANLLRKSNSKSLINQKRLKFKNSIIAEFKLTDNTLVKYGDDIIDISIPIVINSLIIGNSNRNIKQIIK